ncbi:MAG TPA: outer membrane beta-barrel protein [Reyranella sp.]|jgi:outer membrane immunogenic protein|nr:outer membrane beta-barrel protein [Reyranella sp.]
MRKWTSLGLAIAVSALATTQVAAQQASPSWNGFYAGLNAGGMFGNTSGSVAGPGGPAGFSGTGSGFVGGGQAGYNYLLGPVVLGGEIDFQGSTFAAGVNGGGAFGPFSTTERMPWFSTMRARVGYAVGSVMPYLTGGAVWGQRSIDGPISASANYWTWTAGGGIEGFITERWSMKAEYLYMGTPSTSLLPGSNETASNNLVRVGVNYHF